MIPKLRWIMKGGTRFEWGKGVINFSERILQYLSTNGEWIDVPFVDNPLDYEDSK
jgi:hypothetical protein